MSRASRSGVEGNERLTSFLAILLFVGLAAVGLTVPLAQSQTRLHVILGTLVIPPVLVKVASTTWRMVRYYAGAPDYRRKGPPFLLLRLLGPILVILTFILLFSGVGLIVGAPHSWHARLAQLHNSSFILWFFAMTVHVLGHLQETIQYGPRDLVARTRRQVSGASTRVWVSLSSFALGGVAAVWIAPYAHNGVIFGN